MFLEYYYPCLTKWSLHGVQKPVEVSEPGAPVLLRLNESLTHTLSLAKYIDLHLSIALPLTADCIANILLHSLFDTLY